MQFLRATPDAAGVAPLYLNPDGSPQPFHFRSSDLRDDSGQRERACPPHSCPTAPGCSASTGCSTRTSEPRPVPQPSASCLLLRRACSRRDIFDERFPIFFNDVQLARSLADRGRTLWVTPTPGRARGSCLRPADRARASAGACIRLSGPHASEETEPAASGSGSTVCSSSFRTRPARPRRPGALRPHAPCLSERSAVTRGRCRSAPGSSEPAAEGRLQHGNSVRRQRRLGRPGPPHVRLTATYLGIR